MRTISRLAVPVLAILALAPSAGARTRPTTVPKGTPVVVCLASPEKTLEWLEGARDLLGRLGLSMPGLAQATETTRRAAGADLLTVQGWLSAGLDPEVPVCAWMPGNRDKDLALSFGIANERRARDVVTRLVAAVSEDEETGKVPEPVAATVGKYKAWRVAGGRGKAAGKEGILFSIVDGTGVLATGKGPFEALAAGTQDRAADLAFPDGAVSLVALADVARLAEALDEDDTRTFARDWVTGLRLDLSLARGEVACNLKLASGTVLQKVGALAEHARPAGAGLLAAVPALATGFLRLDLPWKDLVAAARDAAAAAPAKGKGAKKAPAARDPKADALVDDFLGACLPGEVDFALVDGLAGMGLVAAVADAGRCAKALDAVVQKVASSGLTLTDETGDVGGVAVRTLRFGKVGDTLGFPLYAALREDRLVVALTPASTAALATGSGGGYLAAVDNPLVKDGLSRGAALLSHGFEADSLGGLSGWAAVLRGALVGRFAGWMDLWDLPAVVLDLLYDTVMVGDVRAKEIVVSSRSRFLGADPKASDPRERAYGEAVRQRVAGRTTAWRTALLDLTRGTDRYAERARRALVAPESLSELTLLSALTTLSARGQGEGAKVIGPAPEGPNPEEQCQEYAVAACMGRGPDTAECRDARKYLDLDRPPLTAAEGRECLAKARALEVPAGGDGGH